VVDKQKAVTPPYATYGSFTKFISDLRETGVPPRIDKTVFKTTSGSVIYSVLAALKFLKLIEENGTPNSNLSALVDADEDQRPAELKQILKSGYPPIFGGGFDLSQVSAGQFNELIRDEYEVQASTVDKIAAFLLSACKDAGIEVSTHLQTRKAIAPSTNSKKSRKQRKPDQTKTNNDGDATIHPLPPEGPISEKALEYRLVDLMTEAAGDAEVMASIINVITFLKTKDARVSSEGAASKMTED